MILLNGTMMSLGWCQFGQHPTITLRDVGNDVADDHRFTIPDTKVVICTATMKRYNKKQPLTMPAACNLKR